MKGREPGYCIMDERAFEDIEDALVMSWCPTLAAATRERNEDWPGYPIAKLSDTGDLTLIEEASRG